MGSEQFSLSWDDFHKTLSSGMNSLYENENLVDVTLAIDGKYLKAHKIVLSVCSTYFRTLFNDNPCKHPIVFLKDVSYDVMNYLLTFIYKGEVQVGQEDLASFIATAEALQIKGLTNNENEKIKSTESKSKSKRSHSDDNKQKKSSCPLPKKVKLIESNPLDVPTSSLDSKTDSNIQHLVSQQPQNPTNSDENAIECIQIQPKMEQFYHNENEQDENNVFDETQGDIYTEEVYQDNMGGDNCEFFDTVDSKPGASQADQTQDFWFMPTRKGHTNLIYKNFRFYLERRHNDSVFWKCCYYVKMRCRARCVTKHGKISLASEQHNHPPGDFIYPFSK